MKKVITHNGSFHADDVFGVATLQLHFGVENVEVVRTRDEAIIATGDIVLDVGGVYDPEKQRFDHHQNGAPVRDNGIPYAAFGLVWKHYGEQVAGSKEAAETIERQLVMPIDAADNGLSLYQLSEKNISPMTVQGVVGLWKPEWGSDGEMDVAFKEACELARVILSRAIAHAQADFKAEQAAETAYEKSLDKRLIVSDIPLPSRLFIKFLDTLIIVCPDEDPRTSKNWTATAVRVGQGGFESRVQFPKAWAGLRNEELATVSGIPDAVFCHKTPFVFVAKSKEGVLAAAKKALAE